MSVPYVCDKDWVELINYVDKAGRPLVGRVRTTWGDLGDGPLGAEIIDVDGHVANYRVDMIERTLSIIEVLARQ